MKTVVVTGAGGFIGGALTRKLLEKGYKVYGVDISERVNEIFADNQNFVPICADLTKCNFYDRIEEIVDAVFYLSWAGALGGADLYDEKLQLQNVSTSADVCKNSVGRCNHFIFCGSSYEFMKNSEHTNLPMNIYGIAKKAAADVCYSIALRNNMKFNKVILTNTYGVGDYSRKAVNTIVNIMQNDLPLNLVSGDNPNDWVYIDDTVNGLISVLELGKAYKEYYIGHRNITTFKEKIIIMRDILCPNRELKFGTLEENTFIDYSMTNLDALYNDTGFECSMNFADSIAIMDDWVKNIFE